MKKGEQVRFCLNCHKKEGIEDEKGIWQEHNYCLNHRCGQ